MPRAPFVATELVQFALQPQGADVIAWSPDGTQVLYVGFDRGEAWRKIYLFDVYTHQSKLLVDDAYPLSYYSIDPMHPLWPAWDAATNTIVYVRNTPEGHTDLVAIDPDGKLVRLFLADIHVGGSLSILLDSYPDVLPWSLIYPFSISRNGRVGVLTHDKIVSMHVGEPDTFIPLADDARARLSHTGSQDYRRLWLAPDGIHYALGITNTLQVYAADHPQVSLSLDSVGLVGSLLWSPDSHAIAYHLASTEGLGTYSFAWYAQRITETTPQAIGRDMKLPRLEYGAYFPDSATWSNDSQWLVMRRGGAVQCSPGCIYSQTIFDPFAPRATILWADKRSTYGAAIWSPDGTRLAHICQHPGAEGVFDLCIVTIKRSDS